MIVTLPPEMSGNEKVKYEKIKCFLRKSNSLFDSYREDLLCILDASSSKEEYEERQKRYEKQNNLVGKPCEHYWRADWSMILHILEKFNKEILK